MTTLKKGDKAPDFSALDQDGKSHQLADDTPLCASPLRVVVIFLVFHSTISPSESSSARS